MRTAPSGRPSLEEEAVSGSRGTHRPDPATARLAGWIGPVVDGAGYDLEELVVTPAGRRSVVRVVVDRDAGRHPRRHRRGEPRRLRGARRQRRRHGPRPYVLEVTSPGVDRPLTEPRHWRRNIGRLVTVAVGPAGGADEVTGRVTAVDDAGVTLAVEAKGKPGAKKRPPTPRQVPWAQLGAGRVQVEFGRAERRRPDDDADDDAGRRPSPSRRRTVNIDVTALKAVEREKGIPADTVIEAIESALVTAYRHADGAAKHVRVHVDRKSGEVAVLAQELGPDGEVVREWDDTPTDFGRIAASTAKQVIVQRLRDAEHEQTFGEYAGKEGDIVSGIVQAHDRRNVQGTVLIDIGKVEAVLPAGRAGARRGVHPRQPDQGLRRVGGAHLPRPAGHRLAHPPEPGPQAVRPRGARDRRRQRRDRRGGPRGRAPVEDRRPHQGARAERQGRPASARWASGCAT